jgi:hypothetical protein
MTLIIKWFQSHLLHGKYHMNKIKTRDILILYTPNEFICQKCVESKKKKNHFIYKFNLVFSLDM